MKLSVLAFSTLALAALCGGSALGQSTAPATMQPIPNPPETTKPVKHHAKHHAMHAKTDAVTPPAK